MAQHDEGNGRGTSEQDLKRESGSARGFGDDMGEKVLITTTTTAAAVTSSTLSHDVGTRAYFLAAM